MASEFNVPMTLPILRREKVWMLSTATSESFLSPFCRGRFYQHTNIGHSQKIVCNQGYGDQFRVRWKLPLDDEGRTRLAEGSRRRDRITAPLVSLAFDNSMSEGSIT
jgi:hypothetical protein